MNRSCVPMVLLASAFVLAACSGSQTPSAGAGGDEAITLDLWVVEGEETFIPTLKEEFESKHPNVTINVTNIPEDSYSTKMDTALLAGNAPDVGSIYEPRWMKAGRVRPLDDVIESKGIDTTRYNQAALSFCVLDGKTYCLGSYSGLITLFYSKDMFDEAGLEYPSATEPMTMDDYAALAQALTVPNEDPAQHVWGGSASVPTWWSDHRTLFSEDGRRAVGFVNDAATIHAYEVLSGMIQDGTAPSDADATLLGVDLLVEGQQAMAISDNVSQVPSLEQAGIDWGAALTPVERQGDQPWVSAFTDYWGVFEGSDHPEWAAEFVAFVGTRGNELRANAGAMPLDLAVAEETDWAEDSQGRADLVEIAKFGRPNLFLPAGVFTLDTPLWDSFGLIVDGEITAQQTLDDAASAMQQKLDHAWTTWEEL